MTIYLEEGSWVLQKYFELIKMPVFVGLSERVETLFLIVPYLSHL